GQPLVDGLANANPGCPGGSTTDGFQVSPATLTTITRQVTLCLLGYVPGWSNLQVKGQSGSRACEGTNCSVGNLSSPSPSPTPVCPIGKRWQDPPGKCVG
ncbi:MAG: hypothetical protein HC851_22845, partial [Acaryochloris sp. RU_4_1]|nr:hypothetical protein [Acaryochloris sp. RU_4_1]